MTTDLEAEVEALPAMVDGRGLKLVYRGEVIKLIEAHHKAERAAREELAEMAEKLNRYGYVLFAKKTTQEEKEWINNAFSEVAIRLQELSKGAADAQAKQERTKD